jgi:tetratricopeptide (TPR) repeat protein
VSQYSDDDLLEEHDDDIVAPRRVTTKAAKDKLSGTGKLLVVGAVVIGIVLGAWAAGKLASGPGANPSSGPATSSTGDPGLRLAELEAILLEDPSNIDALMEAGVILFNAGNLEAARDSWETVLEIDDTIAEAWFNLGFYYLGIEPPDEAGATAAWNRVVELSPGSELALAAQQHLSWLEQGEFSNSPTPSETGS